MGTMIQVPYKELYLSSTNTRKSQPGKRSDAEVKASIAAIGILQNLIVGKKDDRGYPVEAGDGLRQIQILQLGK